MANNSDLPFEFFIVKSSNWFKNTCQYSKF